jgi:hypothetical protein
MIRVCASEERSWRGARAAAELEGAASGHVRLGRGEDSEEEVVVDFVLLMGREDELGVNSCCSGSYSSA